MCPVLTPPLLYDLLERGTTHLKRLVVAAGMYSLLALCDVGAVGGGGGWALSVDDVGVPRDIEVSGCITHEFVYYGVYVYLCIHMFMIDAYELIMVVHACLSLRVPAFECPCTCMHVLAFECLFMFSRAVVLRLCMCACVRDECCV